MIAGLSSVRRRYLASAAICAVSNNILLIVFAQAGLNLFNLTLLSFAVVGSLGYALHVRLTFRQAPGWSSYARFMAGVALGIPAAYGALALLSGILHLPMTIAAPLATVMLLIYNYLSARLAILGRFAR